MAHAKCFGEHRAIRVRSKRIISSTANTNNREQVSILHSFRNAHGDGINGIMLMLKLRIEFLFCYPNCRIVNAVGDDDSTIKGGLIVNRGNGGYRVIYCVVDFSLIMIKADFPNGVR